MYTSWLFGDENETETEQNKRLKDRRNFAHESFDIGMLHVRKALNINSSHLSALDAHFHKFKHSFIDFPNGSTGN